jgi:hypothetical protein
VLEREMASKAISVDEHLGSTIVLSFLFFWTDQYAEINPLLVVEIIQQKVLMSFQSPPVAVFWFYH